MIAIYWLQFLLTAAALGRAAWVWPLAFGHLRGEVRVAVGLTLTPLALALETLAIALVAPGVPAIVFLLVPGSLAAGVILAAGIPASPRIWQPRQGELLSGAVLGAAVLTALLAAGRGAALPATGHDFLIYLNEARAFALHPSYVAIPGFDAAPGAVLKTHPHQFLFQAYLAQAMLAEAPWGHPQDQLVRFVAQLPLPLLMLAVAALARAAQPSWAAALAAPAMLMFHADYIAVASSVDAFRLLPLLALLTVLMACIGPRASPPWQSLMVIGALTGPVLAAHSLHLALGAILALAALAATGLGWIRREVLIRLGYVSAPFALLGAATYLDNWLRYGSVFGRGFYFPFYRGTSLEAAFQQESWFVVLDPFRAFLWFAWLAGMGLMLAANAGAIGQLRWARDGRPRFLALAVLLVVWLPLLPLTSLQGAMLSNLRYGLSTAALCSAMIAVAAGSLLKWAGASPARVPARHAVVAAIGVAIGCAGAFGWYGVWQPETLAQTGLVHAVSRRVGVQIGLVPPLIVLLHLAAVLAVLCAAALTFRFGCFCAGRGRLASFRTAFAATLAGALAAAALFTSLLWHFPTRAEAEAQVAEDRSIAAMVRSLPQGARWAVDDYSVVYRVQSSPLFLYSEPARPLLAAKTAAEAKEALRAARVSLVAFDKGDSHWWPSTPLYAAVSRAPPERTRRVGKWQVFLGPFE